MYKQQKNVIITRNKNRSRSEHWTVDVIENESLYAEDTVLAELTEIHTAMLDNVAKESLSARGKSARYEL